jgi:hypothetical protein
MLTVAHSTDIIASVHSPFHPCAMTSSLSKIGAWMSMQPTQKDPKKRDIRNAKWFLHVIAVSKSHLKKVDRKHHFLYILFDRVSGKSVVLPEDLREVPPMVPFLTQVVQDNVEENLRIMRGQGVHYHNYINYCCAQIGEGDQLSCIVFEKRNFKWLKFKYQIEDNDIFKRYCKLVMRVDPSMVDTPYKYDAHNVASMATLLPIIEVANFCAVCDKDASSRCSRCQGVRYCSTQCQREHWATHKEICQGVRTSGSIIGAISRDYFTFDKQ